MKHLFAFLLLFTMATSTVVSVWGQWQAGYEWAEAEDGKEENQNEETNTEKEVEKEMSSSRSMDCYLKFLVDLSRGNNSQMPAHDFERLHSQCHGALPDLPPEVQ